MKKRPGRMADPRKTSVRKKNTARLRAGGQSAAAATVDDCPEAVRMTRPSPPADVVVASGGDAGVEAEALAKLAEYRPMVIDLLLAMGMGTNGEPLELRRRVLTDLAKLGLRLPPVSVKRDDAAAEGSDGLERRLVEHFERYQRALSSGD